MTPEDNPYTVLGVLPDATDKQIKAAYRRQCNACHPDKHAGKGEVERNAYQQQFIRVQRAYEVLSDPQERAYFDRHGRSRSSKAEEPESKVDATIVGIWRKLIDPDKLTSKDYAREVRLHLTDQRIEARTLLARMRQVLAQLQRGEGRFLRENDPENPFTRALRADIAEMSRVIAAKEEEVEHLKQCLDEIGRYTYTTEAGDAETVRFRITMPAFAAPRYKRAENL